MRGVARDACRGLARRPAGGLDAGGRRACVTSLTGLSFGRPAGGRRACVTSFGWPAGGRRSRVRWRRGPACRQPCRRTGYASRIESHIRVTHPSHTSESHIRFTIQVTRPSRESLSRRCVLAPQRNPFHSGSTFCAPSSSAPAGGPGPGGVRGGDGAGGWFCGNHAVYAVQVTAPDSAAP